MDEEARLIAAYEREQPTLLNGKYKTRWFPNGETPKTAIEEAILWLRKHARPGPNNIGAEWWVQLVEAGPGGSIGWHVDKDESVASNKHYLLHPETASILYMTDIGGATVITDQWSPHGSGYHPQDAEHGYMSYPKRNKYVLFHGELLHGVIPGHDNALPPGTKRLTFLVNWWDVKPEEPNCSLLRHHEVKGLHVMNPSELEAFRARLYADKTSPPTRRASIPNIDLTPNTKKQWFNYEYALPGGARKVNKLPVQTGVMLGKTLHLIWHPKWLNKNTQGTSAGGSSGKGKDEL